MVDTIKNELDNYLEFDSKDLFIGGDLIRVFGGALRDIISGQKINDVDILVGSQSIGYLKNVLNSKGYKFLTEYQKSGMSHMYKDIMVISEPHTWVKNDKIIQLIRPRLFETGPKRHPLDPKNKIEYQNNFVDLIRNVDISCCGLSYDGNRLYEDYPNAVLHCRNKVFYVNKKAKMYSMLRGQTRIHKLLDRGWERIEGNIGVIERDLKIKNLFE